MTSTLQGMLEVFDVLELSSGSFVGHSDAGDRDVIDGSQVLAQSIVAATKSIPGKTVRRASAVFCRPVRAHEDIDFDVQVVQDGRSFATVIVTSSQQGKACVTCTLLLDIPSADVIRHPDVVPLVGPDHAIELHMPVEGREIRLVGVSDPNDPDVVGPAELDAWLRYTPVPERDDLQRALLAHFTGHLSISTTFRGHVGIGTRMSHRTVSTAPMAISVSFHEPIGWEGWIDYRHDSTFVGGGMSYVRGEVRTQEGRLIASFTQDALIKPLETDARALAIAEKSRL